ncbi:MAG: hypothetical protein JWM28_2133 [Chitinophagaceae bacterium]|nr:hypothetical protein [Chitinophagaceae bacterium]
MLQPEAFRPSAWHVFYKVFIKWMYEKKDTKIYVMQRGMGFIIFLRLEVK